MNIIIRRKKLRLGLIYGMVAGLAFATFAWGVDAWLLARAHATFFWVKFIPSLIVCVLSGGLVGWLTIRFEKHSISLLLWGSLAGLYSWLVIWLPFTLGPYLVKTLAPELAHWIDFSQVQDLIQFRVVSLVIIGLAAIICGLLEINLIHQALLSSYVSASVVAMLVCLILFSLAGSATDSIVTATLREPVQVINNLIQFAQVNEGLEVPLATARKLHISAVNQITGLIQRNRQLTLIKFDQNFLFMDILVDFEGTLVKCTAIYAQPTDCIIITPNP